jgi:hypothetical protein
MSKPKVIIRRPDVCPKCSAVNSIRLTHGYRQAVGFRVAYGKCKLCGERVTIRMLCG